MTRPEIERRLSEGALRCLTWDEGPPCSGRFYGEHPSEDKWRWCEHCRTAEAVATLIEEMLGEERERCAALAEDELGAPLYVELGTRDAVSCRIVSDARSIDEIRALTPREETPK